MILYIKDRFYYLSGKPRALSLSDTLRFFSGTFCARSLSLFLLDYILGWVFNWWNLLLLLPQGRMGEGGGGQMGGFGFMEDVPKPLLPVRFFLEHTCCFVVSLFLLCCLWPRGRPINVFVPTFVFKHLF